MNSNHFIEQIGKEESEQLEYKMTLPPSKNIARNIAAFSNSNGGILIIGIQEGIEGIKIVGLEKSAHAQTITFKALSQLNPKPNVEHGYFEHQGKRLYGIKVDKSDNSPIMVDSKIYIRQEAQTKAAKFDEIKVLYREEFKEIDELNKLFISHKKKSTQSKLKLIEHYQGVLKLIGDLKGTLYPKGTKISPEEKEGKILLRVLFSSCMDNFELFMTDILYEIFLAKPESLKSNSQVTVKEVLNCTDIEEFVKYWANKKLNKLQRGSVKGFLSENKQISDLNVIDENIEAEIEKILQIRHLYTHKNGVIDEKFMQYFSDDDLEIGKEHLFNIEEFVEKIKFIEDIVNEIDIKAIDKFNLDVTED